MATYKVIDVSHHQGTIDWSKVKASGVVGAIIRVSDSTGTMDRQCDRNIKECERLGIPFGLYIYSRAKNEAVLNQEINIILNKANGHTIQFPLYIDLECPGCESYAATAAEKFGAAVEKSGYWAGVYANLFWWENYLSNVTRFTKWVARYNTVCGMDCDMWQYSSTGNVNGISGHVDMNHCYRWFPNEISGSTVRPSNPNTAPSGSTLDLAVAVMKGEYGDGDTRKKRLGTRYNEVQNFINHIAKASANTLATETKAGKYGNGTTRKIVLGSRYDEVMKIVNSGSSSVYYTIQSGDTLSEIAAKYGTTYQKLASMNGISDPNKIYAGQKIRIK